MSSGTAPSSPESFQRYIKVAEVFTPSAPIDSEELFAGRKDQVTQVISAVVQKGQHVILYGERGVGKTSFANVISQIMRSFSEQNVSYGIVNCDGIDDFTSLWEKIFREIEETRKYADTPAEQITPESVRYTLQEISGKTIIVIDELDRLGGALITELLADTIKTLSDHLVDVTLVMVGVADSVNELIAEHASIERSLVQIQMPRMSVAEMYELLDKRLKILEMSIGNQIKQNLVFLSQGLPSYTHLLALHACQKAISKNSKVVDHDDLDFAISMAVEKAYQSILTGYHKAISSARQTIYAPVLLSCALAKKDDLGFFAPADVQKPMSLIMEKEYRVPNFSRHLNDFSEETRGPILIKRGVPRNYRYRFVNPMMQPYVIMNGLANELLTPKALQELQ